jgi:alpha-2-macroglobulin
VHPAELYVGLRSDRTFVERGQPLKIEIIVVDLDGVAEPDRPVRSRPPAWSGNMRGAWRQEAVDVQNAPSARPKEPVSCTFETEMGGEYQITATVMDARAAQREPVHPLGERRAAPALTQG